MPKKTPLHVIVRNHPVVSFHPGAGILFRKIYAPHPFTLAWKEA